MNPSAHTSKLIFTACLLLAWATVLHAQQAATDATTGIIYGRVITDKRVPVAGAAIQLFLQNNIQGNQLRSLKTTAVTSKNGEFQFVGLSTSTRYAILVHATGFVSKEITVIFAREPGTSSASIKDLGGIRMEPDLTALDTVNVTTSRQLLQLYPDKKIFNLEKDISVAGATAEDALRNIPGIVVDVNGNILVRNSSPQVFIDGRPSTLLLSQVPADQVESVELMTNPSAKYDASSTGGIINLVLKKNKLTGYNGALRAGIDSRLQPLGGGDINLKDKQVNIFASAQLSARKSLGTASSHRIEYLNPGNLLSQQQNAPENKGYYGFARLGLDFFVNNRTTITTSGNYGKGNYKVTDAIDIFRDSIPASNSSATTIKRLIGADIDFKSLGGVIAVKHNFAQAGKELTADLSFNRHQNDNTSSYHSSYFDAYGNPKPAVGAEIATGRGISRFYTFQSDFTSPGPKQSKFETGIRIAVRNYGSFNHNYRETPAGSMEYRLLPATGVEFNFDDIVMAAYGSYSNSFKSLSYQLGLRMESSLYQGELINKNQKFKTEYPLNLFPSAYITQRISDKQFLHINYSRKINRPNFFQILPFVDFSDSLNLNVGNPALLPEFSNIGELIYQLDYKNSQSFFATLYVRQSSNLITRYQYKAPNTDPSFSDSLIYNSFANAGSSYTYGLELISRNKIGSWWEIVSNLNLFDVRLNAGNLAGAKNDMQKSWFAKMTNIWKLPSDFSIQLSGDYQAKTILPPGFSRNSSTSGFGGGMYGFTANISQGYVKPIYGVDISVRKDFLKNNAASLALQVNDILRTRTYATVAESKYFEQENFRRRDPQVFRLNFSWRFGKLDAGLDKRRNSRNETENIQSQQGGQ